MSEERERLARFRQIVELDPDDAASWFLLGREAAGAGELEEARRAFAKALELDPRYTAAYRQLGDVLVRLGASEAAESVWTRGMKIAEETGDLQAGKEMQALLRRLARDRDR